MEVFDAVSKETNISQAQADEIVSDYLKVVPIRDGRPLINDIPNRLRHLAELIESGEVAADFALIVIDGEEAVPNIYGYGNAMDTRSILGLLDQAHEWFMREVFKAGLSK